MSAPDWTRRAVWYHLYPLGFLGAEASNPVPLPHHVNHRLRQLEPWLDYFSDLGVTGLLLGPVFASESHGYDTVDYFRVDPRLGDESDLEWLFEECRRRDLRVLLDGVFNHVGRAFPNFREVVERRVGSDSARWFRVDFSRPGPVGFSYDTFEGHEQLVALNHAEPAVLDFVVSVADHWLSRGAAGFRLDAAYAVPTSFWRAFAERVRARYLDTYLCGEVLHGDYRRFVQESALDAVTQYELWKAIWSGLNDRNFFELAWALRRHQELTDAFLPLTFVGNHDVTRIASQLRDSRDLDLALTVLFTVPGTPTIYAGDEQGWRGVKHHRAGGDVEIRPAFPRTPAELDPSGTGIYRAHQELANLRRRHPWTFDGRLEVLHLANQQVAYQVSGADNTLLVAAFNVGDEPASVSVTLKQGATTPLQFLRGQSQSWSLHGTQLRLDAIPPHSAAILASPGA